MREMKDSGVAWIGSIPNNWNIMTIGSLFNNRNEKVNDTDYPPLSVSKGGIVPQMENVAKSDAKDNRKQVLVNDFVINSRSDRKQSCGVSKLDGSVSLINTVLYSKSDNTIVSDYNGYLLKNYGFAEEFYRWGHGIVADLWTTRWQEMKNIELPVPSYQEQKLILADIDKQSKKVSALIANQEQQIEKLKAYKQSLITEVVTKGLNPDAPMKPSGVEWIGEIPEHWMVCKSNHLLSKIGDVDHYMPNSVNEGIPYIMTGDLKPKASDICFSKCKQISIEDYQLLSSKIKTSVGDIIFARYATVGTVCYVDIEKDFVVSYSCVTIKPNEKIYGKFLYYYYQSRAFLEEVNRLTNSNTQSNIGIDSMARTATVCPPIIEQQQIVEHLDEKCAAIDRLIEIKQQKIEKLNDYKKSLIYEYVTGKKEVL